MLPLPALPASTLPLPGGWVGGLQHSGSMGASPPALQAGLLSFVPPTHLRTCLQQLPLPGWLAVCCQLRHIVAPEHPVLAQRGLC